MKTIRNVTHPAGFTAVTNIISVPGGGVGPGDPTTVAVGVGVEEGTAEGVTKGVGVGVVIAVGVRVGVRVGVEVGE